MFTVACVVALLGWALAATIWARWSGEASGQAMLTLVGGSLTTSSDGPLPDAANGVSFGATAVAGSKVRDGLYYAIVALSALGVLATIVLASFYDQRQPSRRTSRARQRSIQYGEGVSRRAERILGRNPHVADRYTDHPTRDRAKAKQGEGK